jgi:hypothetical protein
MEWIFRIPYVYVADVLLMAIATVPFWLLQAAIELWEKRKAK